MTTMIHRLRQFTGSRRGNVAVMTALCALPLLGMVGLSVDYATALVRKTKLDAAADAAAIAAITKAQAVITANSGTTGTALTDGQTQGAAAFQLNAGANPPIPVVLVTRNTATNTLSATVKYNATSTASFGRMFGVPSINVTSTAASSAGLLTYKNIYILVDNSQSMGIAATQADMNKLAGLTPGNCVFGCHVALPGQSQSNEQIAHANGVSLRIDVIKQAIQQMISSAQGSANGSPTISIGLYEIQEYIPQDGANYYTTLSSPTTNYSTLTTIANAIDLGNNDTGGVGDSDFANSIPLFNTNQLGTSGNGSSSSSPQNFVFLMTDGVQDVKGGCTDGHCTQAFNASLCQSMQSKGATVGVIYTTYVPFPTEQTYKDLVAPIQSQIAPNLQSCANPGWYYQASDGPDITKAINSLFAQAVSAQKLTQ